MRKQNFQFLFLFVILVYSILAQHDKIEKIPSPIWGFPKNPTNNGEKYVALTFDDGPHKHLTPDLLDALKRLDAKVTFFVMGIKVIMHPKIVKRAMAEGHEIANHVWNHPVLSKIPLPEVDRQLRMTSEAIYNATSVYPKVMRPPYGNTNRKLNRHISQDDKYPIIMWSLDTNDWRKPSPREIVESVMKKIDDGTVILCHDIHPGTIEAIPLLVQELKKKGFILKTVSELIELHYLTPPK